MCRPPERIGFKEERHEPTSCGAAVLGGPGRAGARRFVPGGGRPKLLAGRGGRQRARGPGRQPLDRRDAHLHVRRPILVGRVPASARPRRAGQRLLADRGRPRVHAGRGRRAGHLPARVERRGAPRPVALRRRGRDAIVPAPLPRRRRGRPPRRRGRALLSVRGRDQPSGHRPGRGGAGAAAGGGVRRGAGVGARAVARPGRVPRFRPPVVRRRAAAAPRDVGGAGRVPGRLDGAGRRGRRGRRCRARSHRRRGGGLGPSRRTPGASALGRRPRSGPRATARRAESPPGWPCWGCWRCSWAT